jgi:hypothetical protein
LMHDPLLLPHHFTTFSKHSTYATADSGHGITVARIT